MKLFAFVMILLAFAPATFAAPYFKVKTLGDWKLSDRQGDENQIYLKTNGSKKETIVLQSFKVTSEDADFQKALPENKSDLESVRALFYNRAGMTGYQILDLSNRKSEFSAAPQMQVIQSRFRNLSGHEVQSLEHQFFANNRLYIVTYTEESVALNDTTRIDVVMNLFEPDFSAGREPSSVATDTATTHAQPVPSASSAKKAEATQADPAVAIRDLDMDLAANQERCASVPVEKRRKAGDVAFSLTLGGTLNDGWGCLIGVKDNLWGIVTGIGSLAVDAWKLLNPNSSKYRDQVIASVGTIVSEVRKDPIEFATRVGIEIYNAATKTVGDFFQCLSPKEQMKSVCNIATNLLPLGLIVKVATKAPLAVKEMARLSKVIYDSVAVGKKGKVVAKAEEIKPVTNVAERGGLDGHDTAPVEVTAVNSADTNLVPVSAPSEIRMSPIRATTQESDYVSQLAGDKKAYADLKLKIGKDKTLTARQRETQLATLDSAHAKSLEIEKGYGDLLKEVRSSRGEIDTLIVDLEKAKVPKNKIRETIKNSQLTCPIK